VALAKEGMLRRVLQGLRMKIAAGNTLLYDAADPMLQTDRPLVPIDEYAAQQGVSRGVIEQCGKLGIIQIRRCKGQEFVVDVPVNSHQVSAPDFDRIVPAEKAACAEKTAEPADMVCPGESAQNTQALPSKVGTIQAGAISQRIKKMYCDAADIKGVPAETAQHEINKIVEQFSRPQAKVSVSQPPKLAKQPPPIEIIPEPINDIDKPPANIEQFDWDRVLEETAQLPQPKTSDTDKPIALGTPHREFFEKVPKPYAQVKSARQSRYSANHSRASFSMPQQKFNWRKAATFLMACFCVTLFVNLWFYVGWEIQLNRAAKTDAHIKQLVTDTANANKRSRAILGDINGSKTEIGRVKAELDNSAAELKRVQDELVAVRAGIADIRQGNSDAVKRLTEQIRKLTGQLAELKNSVETGTDAVSAR